MSDSLGTATELRAMSNYAGHRLAPWLGHLMISRQEAARPLLTPGEIMQLPPTDEIVMVTGTPPIRAKKARYFEDERFAERVLPPPEQVESHPAEAAQITDEWSNRVISSGPEASQDRHDLVADPTNAGIRREPELPEHKEILPPKRPPEREFDLLDDGPEVDAAKAREMRQRMRMVARQASMDPADGIEL